MSRAWSARPLRAWFRSTSWTASRSHTQCPNAGHDGVQVYLVGPFPAGVGDDPCPNPQAWDGGAFALLWRRHGSIVAQPETNALFARSVVREAVGGG
jgi:hypothetical protein